MQDTLERKEQVLRKVVSDLRLDRSQIREGCGHLYRHCCLCRSLGQPSFHRAYAAVQTSIEGKRWPERYLCKPCAALVKRHHPDYAHLFKAEVVVVEEKPAPVVQPEGDSTTNVKQAFDLVVKFGPGTIRELTNRATLAGVATPPHLSQNLNSLKRQERLNRWQRGSEWVYYLTDRETDGLAEIKTNRDQAIDLILRFGEGLTAREIKARLAAEGEQLGFDLKSTLLTLAKPSVRKLTTKRTVTGENRYYLPETQESQRHAS